MSINGGKIGGDPWVVRSVQLTLWCALLYGATAILAQGQSSAPDASSQRGATTSAITSGPEVGQKIPPFRARDQFGRWQDFNSLRGPKGAVILFNRSADW